MRMTSGLYQLNRYRSGDNSARLFRPPERSGPRRRWGRHATRTLGALLAGCWIASSVAAQDNPAAAPQATAVGADTCLACHDEVGAAFQRSTHGALASFERAGQHAGCEACHGPGSAHAESGDAASIRSFKNLGASEASTVCVTCHRRDKALDWAASDHAMSGVGCTNCHTIHRPRRVVPGPIVEAARAAHATAPPERASLAASETELCLNCHREQRAKLNYSSHHPVREGRMTCSSCHEVHGSTVRAVRSNERVNDLCYRCHAGKQGPFVFEHQPVQESCTTCHEPHGTLANNLLKQGEPFLCLQCHEMHFHNARVGLASPFYLPAGGSTNPNGVLGFQQAFGTRCTACHSRIHGSDLPSQGVSGRGKALTR